MNTSSFNKKRSSKFLGATVPGEYYNEVLEYHNQTETTTDDLTLSLSDDDDDVLIEVYYSDVNPVDIQKLKNFKLPQPQPSSSSKGDDGNHNSNNCYFIPGYGGSGIIRKVGRREIHSNNNNNNNTKDDDTTKPLLKVGQRVCFICDPSRNNSLLSSSSSIIMGGGGGGSYSTHVIVDSRNVAILPPTKDVVSLKDAATIPIAGLTAYESLMKLGIIPTSISISSISTQKTEDKQRSTTNEEEEEESSAVSKKKKKTLLIVGGSGGVGSWSILLARYFGGPKLNIIVTCTSSKQKEWCLSLGADQTIQHNEIDTPSKLPGSKHGCGVDYILCLTEPIPKLFDKLANVIKTYGQICFVVSGKSINSIDISYCFFKCVSIHCQTIFSSMSRTNYEHIIPSQELTMILHLLSTRQINTGVPISPDIVVDHKVSIKFEDALSPNGVLHALSNTESGQRRGKLVLQIQQEEEEDDGEK